MQVWRLYLPVTLSFDFEEQPRDQRPEAGQFDRPFKFDIIYVVWARNGTVLILSEAS
jgi:hypothetical protein